MTKEERIIKLVDSGEFRIDELGRVWRLKSRGKIIKPRRAEHNTGSYLQVRKMIKGERIHVLSHRLVWAYFNGPIPEGKVINHKNGIKDDNRPNNLELTSYSGNHKHAHQTGLIDQRGERNPAHKLTDQEVVKIRLAYDEGGYTQQELGDKYGVDHRTISKIVKGKRRTSAGGPIQDEDKRHNPCDRDSETGQFIGKKAAGRLLDGHQWNQMPEVEHA